ncbi:MAG: metallopeptidase TldD-related protein [Ignavibacteria bacterium]
MIRFACLFVLFSSAAVAQQMSEQEIFRVLQLEISRSMRELRIGELPAPYQIEYILQIRRTVTMHSVQGALEDLDTGSRAVLTVRMHVGTPKFDNTNFFDVSLGFFGSSDDEEGYKNRLIPFELRPEVLRRELWLASDACYKQAVEIYSKKESTLKNRTRKDTTWDYRIAQQYTLNDLASNVYRPNVNELLERARTLSAVFRAYPKIQTSRVGIEVVPKETYYLNSSGARSHKIECSAGIEVIASTQASDGMPLAQTFATYARTPDEFPSLDSLQRAVTAVADVLTKLVDAETIEAYSGPVLFEGQAAGTLIGQFFAPNLVAQRPPLSEGGFSTNERTMAFQNKIGARVLPEFLTGAAEPLTAAFNGTSLTGHYKIDDEGVSAQNVELVKKGYLQTLLSSRVPTKRIDSSNGHQRGGGSMFSVITINCVDTKKTKSRSDLKKQLLKLVKDRALPYGIIARLAMDQNLLFTGVFRQTGSDLPISQGEGKLGLLRAYRVYPDGREELIRGVEAAGIAPSLFKDILAVSKQKTAHNFLAPSVVPSFISGGAAYVQASIITPDILVEDVEVRPLEGDMPKPPVLANPIATD